MNLYSADPQTLVAFFDVVGAGVVVFDVHAQDGVRSLCTNGIFRAMYGLEQAPASSPLPPKLFAMFDEHARQCARKLTPIDFEHPLGDTGQWQRIHMIPVFAAAQSKEVRVFATAVDITDKLQFEQAMQVAHARLHSIVDSSYEGIVTIGTDQCIRTMNQAAGRIFGYREEEVVGQPLTILIPERFRAHHPEYVRQFDRSEEGSRPMESRVEIAGLRKDGTEFMAEITIARIIVSGRTEFVGFIRDISEHMRLMDELYLRASTDPLTGLFNRRYMTEEAGKELTRARRFNHAVSVALVDLDDFKSINDIYGHHIGDKVLSEASSVCRQLTRQLDVMARWGGEEFLFLLPETDGAGAMRQAERVLDALHRVHHNIPELGERQVTASIGIATHRPEEDSFESMVLRADQAMYTAKNTGKNKIISA